MMRTFVTVYLFVLCITFSPQGGDAFGQGTDRVDVPSVPDGISQDRLAGTILYVCSAYDGLDPRFRKLYEEIVGEGESIYPILQKLALRETNPRVAVNVVSFFDKFEGDKTDARKTALTVFEKFPSKYVSFCAIIGNIGEPEDVPSLLPFMNQNLDAFRNVVRAVGKIAAVSQIPDIEKAVADWEKNNWEKLHVDPDKRAANWKNLCQPEVEKAIANIKERNVQWTPPPETPAGVKPAPPLPEPKPPAPEAKPE